jgi:predicted porin
MMQKKVFALALAAGLVSPLAALADNANFTFYGTADVSHDTVSTGSGTTTANGATAVNGVTKEVVSSNVSKFGFKGSEDLGGGLAAVWQIEQQINLDDAAANTFASRNTFAGLKSDSAGTVLMGRHDTPYKLSTRRLDVFADNIADNRALLGGVTANAAGVGSAGASFDGRQNNVLAYISPALAGVTVAVATVNLTEANISSGPTVAQNQKNNSALSMAAMYDAAPFYAAVAHESHKLATVAIGDNESATRLGFGFTQDMFTVGLVYEKTSDNFGAAQANLYGHTGLYLGGKVNFGTDAVKFAYGKAGQLGTITNSAASQVSLGYDHDLSKRTKLYVLYTKLSNGKGINYAFSQNSGAASTTSGFGTSPSALSLGLKHSF